MINIENYIVNLIATSLSDVTVLSDYVDTPPSFPCVTVVEDSNVSAQTFDNASPSENHADLLYSVNVYSNLVSGAKAQAKDIMDRIDAILENLKFERIMCQPMPNVDRTIYRYTARYRVRVGKGVTTTNDNVTTTTYQTFRE